MSSEKKPNFLVIVADDLGFSDTSPFGGEIDTPNLYKLAMEGLRMTDFHTAASCSPTRAMLLSGTDAHIAGLGAMAERMKRFPDIFKDKPGYEGYLNFRVAALPEILQDNGYLTMMSGKWHLGLTKEVAPCSRGFTKVFTTLPGAGNHYNHEPQLYGVTEKPRAFLKGNKGLWMRDDTFIDGDTDLPKNFYSTNSFTDEMLSFLQNRTEDEKNQPFFSYLAFTAPHWPLQAPPEVVKKYRGWYDDGPFALRDRRLKSLIINGLVPADVEPAPIHTLGTGPWAKLSDEEKKKSSRAMEIYAAMVDLIDVNVGRAYSYLESTGELDNTFIIFISDNGAEGNLLEAVPILAGATMGDVIKKFYDNSLQNLGNHNSFVWYGPQWASAATAPSRCVKSYTTEGGIRCPCIVRYPPAVQSAPGTISHKFTTVMDILPTVLDLTGISSPGNTFRGREVAPIRGRSWIPLMAAKDADVDVYDQDKDIVGWEQLGIAAVRVGNWKAVFLPPPRGEGKWELYDLSKDKGEIHDLAESHPEKMTEMIAHYETYFQESGMFDAYEQYQSALRKAGITRAW
ncbi:arylsulfatase, putative [Talaromyces stipitatus ATCC 10500]|uniref:Arylsulfatase, putative n=1 Tax=Talaromyces stipitatus (strain ATCC 10500 / CBS 375.48 / QM 6759 / NRRL 1006) TaxID=441959 RepID=B8M2K5_TALSN|nr:arylsulfatase, putative [Talaromyces stipitatus ATCC 10500]EED21916.1 arylsulfatase, putative [Talaromyces stipitatus ATCC 10500]